MGFEDLEVRRQTSDVKTVQLPARCKSVVSNWWADGCGGGLGEKKYLEKLVEGLIDENE